MARRLALEEVLRKARLEARRAENASQAESSKARLIQMVTRVQNTLYLQHFWPFLTKRTPVTLNVGQRFYDIPEGYDLDRIEKIYYSDDARAYRPMCRGIDILHYNEYDSFQDERADPPMRWEIVDNDGAEQLEIWPIPQSAGYSLLIQGLRKIKTPVADADIVELDGDLVALYCAAELLASTDKDDSKTKFALAEKRLMQLIASSESASDPIVISGGSPVRRDRHAPPDIRYAPRSG